MSMSLCICAHNYPNQEKRRTKMKQNDGKYYRLQVARTALLRITDAIDGPLWWWWLPSMCLLPPFDLSSIFYQCITMLVHLYLSQAMSQWLLLVTDPCCDDDSLSCVFFCQSTSLGGTFYLSMYVMICAGAIFRSLIWLLDFLRCKPKYWNTYMYLEKLENIWELHQICQSHAAFMIQCGALWWWLGLPGVFGNKHYFSSLEENATSVLLKSSWYCGTLPVEVGDQHLQTTWWLSSPPPSVPSGVLPPPSQTFCHLLPPLTLPLPVIFSTTTP